MCAGITEVGGESVAAVAILHPAQPIGGQRHGFLPAALDEAVPHALDGPAQAVGIAAQIGQGGGSGTDVAAGEHVVGDAAAIGAQGEGSPSPAAWSTYVWVDSADDTAAAVRAGGGHVLSEPFDVMDAGRMAVCADREGAAFCLWEAKRHRGARVVNEH